LIDVDHQALIKKYPKSIRKTESIQVPLKSKKSDISQLLIFFIQYHFFAESKEKQKPGYFEIQDHFKILRDPNL